MLRQIVVVIIFLCFHAHYTLATPAAPVMIPITFGKDGKPILPPGMTFPPGMMEAMMSGKGGRSGSGSGCKKTKNNKICAKEALKKDNVDEECKNPNFCIMPKEAGDAFGACCERECSKDYVGRSLPPSMTVQYAELIPDES